jgi:hypothetical protein
MSQYARHNFFELRDFYLAKTQKMQMNNLRCISETSGIIEV